MSDLVRTYDPAEDQGGTPAEGKIRQVYERLLDRGEEEKAEELRQAEPVSEQKQLAKKVRDYDPVHDQPYNRARIIVKEAYEALQKADRTGEAEKLRFMDNLHPQKEKALELKQELGQNNPEDYERGEV